MPTVQHLIISLLPPNSRCSGSRTRRNDNIPAAIAKIRFRRAGTVFFSKAESTRSLPQIDVLYLHTARPAASSPSQAPASRHDRSAQNAALGGLLEGAVEVR